MNHSTPTIRTIDLGYEQLLVFEGGPDTRVRVLHGATWLTQEGAAGDEILQRGSDVAVRSGRALIEGLQPARVQIVRRVEAGTARLAAWLHGLIREERDAAAAPFDEIWHLVKPLDGSREWAIAGIAQAA